MADDTLVVVCAVCGSGESRYILDACRMLQVLEARGINPNNMHLFVNVSRMAEAKGLLDGLALAQLDTPFSITPENIASFSKFRRGDPSSLSRKLPELAQQPFVNRVNVILINYSSFDGSFGTTDDLVLEQNEIFDMLNGLTKPTLIVCSTWYANRIFYLLDREHTQGNLIKIWDAGNKGITFNWGVRPTNSVVFDIGTVLIYWILDVLYASREHCEVASRLIGCADKMKLSCNMKVEGNVQILLSQPFFGPNPPAWILMQPPPEQILSTTTSPILPAVRPQFSDELSAVIEEFIASDPKVTVPLRSSFWEWVYDEKYSTMALQVENGFARGVEVWKVLKAKQLLRNKNEGAYFMDLLVVFDIDVAFIAFINTKSDL